MAIVSFPESLRSMKVRKKFAVGTGAVPGPNACVYQQKKTVEGKRTSKMKYTAPTNPQTALQQANRLKMHNAVLAWQNLTPAEKNVYISRAKVLAIPGYNLFIREQLNSN